MRRGFAAARTSGRWRSVAALAPLALTLLEVSEAWADDDEQLAATLLGALLVADAAYAAYDLTAAARERPLTTAEAVPEVLLGVPQYLAFNLAFAATQIDDSPFAGELQDLPTLPLVLLAPAAMSTAMTMYGLTSLVDSDAEQLSPSDLAGASALIGLNLPFVAAGLGAGLTGRWPAPVVAGPEIGLGAVALGGSAVLAWRSPTEERHGWLLGVGWSAATVAHGVLSLVFHDDGDELGVARSTPSNAPRVVLLPLVATAEAEVLQGVVVGVVQ